MDILRVSGPVQEIGPTKVFRDPATKVPGTAYSENLLRFPTVVNGDNKTLVPPSWCSRVLP